ncbi:aminopeptidase [Clostridium thermosuccinogenes]|jgi:endoglucanase|uniref:Aminopeptidase n=1 Tax=Clostridium thermosuccinogenes TaxID=84032 RepID=A0A2K2F8H4_9CLOT|nr:M42 family metallopeptidase [Pseudoclostridium thermosuccinogenes]AUS96259.1 aminopeptidase [Pseudoclostridium thermosuccinogenes]PNT93065.1 aminopeptidase [Pseudoclostridium thermosuccinogenes]PNT95082.1 aminopeptidase [Pseudoclostridium thermosuccinogenes]PNT95829.1 aminopeptidase [Pseudoclostridium thermosuccinogenes]
MDYTELLKKLSTSSAVSGQENGIFSFVKSIFEEYCDHVEADKFFNIIGFKKGSGNGKKVMITAHCDEIGLMVKDIEDNGFVRVTTVGGIDARILLAQEVVIHGKKDLYGVIGAKPPHLLKPEEAQKAVKIKDLYIDTGIETSKLKEMVSIGDTITLKGSPSVLQGSRFSSKAMDNRASVLAMVETMKQLSTRKHDADVYFVATVQEEVGAAGAEIAAYNIDPDIAIVIDACHGEMPDCPKDSIFSLGKGPAIGVGPVLHRNLYRKLVDVAKEENIPYQIDVEPGNTGTEAWETQVSRSGIPTALLSIPVRYMHTPVETLDVNDVKNTGKLAADFVSMPAKEMEGLLCF